MKSATPYLLIGGGVAAAGAALLGVRRMAATASAIKEAVDRPAYGGASGSYATLPTFRARTTGYWPFSARADERQMEGGVVDRRGRPLHTLEQHLADPTSHPYVSLSGDDAIFPYGQRLGLDAWPTAVFRVVDTGGHFRGAGKIYRIVGYEPIDVCVDSSKTPVPKTAVATIYSGDNFEKGKAVATSGIRDQTVAGLQEGRTSRDREALARVVQSEVGGRSKFEQLAAAWTVRNRADSLGQTLHAMLVPRGEYGAPTVSGGYASTRCAPAAAAYAVADEVLGAVATQDPTGGAVDFWVPELQEALHVFGAVHRAAVESGDESVARKYAPYASYGSVANVRARQKRDGLRVLGAVGSVELLGRG